MAPLKTTTWQYLRWPVAFFGDEEEGFIFFLHSKGNCAKWCLITKFEYHLCGMTTLRQAVGNDMKKYSLHLTLTFYLNRVTLVLVIFPHGPFRCISSRTAFQSVCVDPLTGKILNMLKLSLKLLDRGRKIQNDVHSNIYYCKPDLISWR